MNIDIYIYVYIDPKYILIFNLDSGTVHLRKPHEMVLIALKIPRDLRY